MDARQGRCPRHEPHQSIPRYSKATRIRYRIAWRSSRLRRARVTRIERSSEARSEFTKLLLREVAEHDMAVGIGESSTGRGGGDGNRRQSLAVSAKAADFLAAGEVEPDGLLREF